MGTYTMRVLLEPGQQPMAPQEAASVASELVARGASDLVVVEYDDGETSLTCQWDASSAVEAMGKAVPVLPVSGRKADVTIEEGHEITVAPVVPSQRLNFFFDDRRIAEALDQ